MTREEAKREIDSLDYYLQNHTGDYGEESHTAMMMAIKALEQEPCEDAISRQAVLDALNKTSGIRGDALKALYDLPSVTPQPKMGHWVKTPRAVMGEGYMWYCDKCEHQVYQDSSRDYPSENYCPNCGARMVKPQEREDKE